MSRQALPAAYNSVSRKLAPSPPGTDAPPDLRVLNVARPESLSEINLNGGPADEEVSSLRAENVELRSRLEQSEQLLQAAAASEEAWLERQKEHEQLLEEKSDVIRNLHHKIQQLQEGSAGANLARAEALQKMQTELEARCQQLKEDEESLMAQMRAMEMAMSRDRAELARQRSEVQRQQAEVSREIELSTRDPQLRERLASLSRRRKEATPTMVDFQLPPIASDTPLADAIPVEVEPIKRRGILSRLLFGNRHS